DREVRITAQTAVDRLRNRRRVDGSEPSVRRLVESKGHPVYEPGDPELCACLAVMASKFGRNCSNIVPKEVKIDEICTFCTPFSPHFAVGAARSAGAARPRRTWSPGTGGGLSRGNRRQKGNLPHP